MSDGRLKINYHGAGEIVPAMEVFDGVREKVLDAGQNTGWQMGEFPAQEVFFGLASGIVDKNTLLYWEFGPEGSALRNEMYGGEVIAFPLGLTPPENTWLNKEINVPDDFKGVKIRSAGLISQAVYEGLGASVVNLAGGEVVPSLQRGVIDAAEFCDSSMDWDLGIHEVCEYCYSPPLHASGAANIFELVINPESWNALPDDLKAIVENACWASTLKGQSRAYIAAGEAHARFIDYGVKMRIFSPEIQTMARDLAVAHVAESSAKDAFYKKAWDSLRETQQGLELIVDITNYEFTD